MDAIELKKIKDNQESAYRTWKEYQATPDHNPYQAVRLVNTYLKLCHMYEEAYHLLKGAN